MKTKKIIVSWNPSQTNSKITNIRRKILHVWDIWRLIDWTLKLYLIWKKKISQTQLNSLFAAIQTAAYNQRLNRFCVQTLGSHQFCNKRISMCASNNKCRYQRDIFLYFCVKRYKKLLYFFQNEKVLNIWWKLPLKISWNYLF